eukprot:EC822375.1.p1 GENE.EC822375.1~~EC822375.1.p1  ORF type:complete len:197 (+),score=90.94 EC822375.1:3-593(+)
MFESRDRIVKKLNSFYSPQYVVNCNPLGQGCDGGMPFLVGKYLNLFGTVKEDCQPYLGGDNLCFAEKCLNHHSPFQQFTVSDYAYVGGYYGASNEQLMMNEIYENGPISVAFMVYDDLVNYKEGIYRHVKLNNENDPIFENANHAVLITGWGVQNGVKYWEVKNSWGSDWGIGGYFWIYRGEDECDIESCGETIKI